MSADGNPGARSLASDPSLVTSAESPARVSIGTIEVTVTPPPQAPPRRPPAPIPARPARLGASETHNPLRAGARRWYGMAQE